MNTKEKIAVMQAFVEGKEIQTTTHYSTEWKELTWVPEWDWTSYNYRVKPEPKFAYVNVYSYANAKATDSASYPTAESSAARNSDIYHYHAVALPVELKEE